MSKSSVTELKKIIFTGGGSAGHVTPNLALIAALRRKGWSIQYIGSSTGIEKEIVEKEGIPFFPISSGKLRRYFDLNNFKDPFKVLKGVWEAYAYIRKTKPAVVFSKGGFVAVPVVVGGWLNRVPVVIHESDMTPGLANKLSTPFASKVCVTFPETLRHVDGGKAAYTGLPIREQLLAGSARRGMELCGFVKGKPVLFIMGGSLGAQKINKAVIDSLDVLLQYFQIVHICGKGQIDAKHAGRRGYKPFEFVQEQLPDLMALADIAVSRAGSTSICEFKALRKPMLLIPLSKQASRGDQILNAASFQKLGYADVLQEEQLTAQTLQSRVKELYERRESYRANMSRNDGQADGTGAIVGLIERLAASR